jgi:hypothetical protein
MSGYLLDFPSFTEKNLPSAVAEIKAYLYRQAEALNAQMSNMTAEKIWQDTDRALSLSNAAKSAEKPSMVAGYMDIRSLVIKTAETAILQSDKLTKKFTGQYLALSDYGKYFEHTTMVIEGSSYGITEMFTYTSQLDTEDSSVIVESKNYIKQGLLDQGTDEDPTPVYGVEIGVLSKKVAANGEVIAEDTTPLKTRFTPTSWELWRYGKRIAYSSEEKVHFPNAVIESGSIDTDDVKIGKDYRGGITTAFGGDETSVTKGLMLYGPLGIPSFVWNGEITGNDDPHRPYMIVTEAGARMQCGYGTCYVIDGGWRAGSKNCEIYIGTDEYGTESVFIQKGASRYDLITVAGQSDGPAMEAVRLLANRLSDLEGRVTLLENA